MHRVAVPAVVQICCMMELVLPLKGLLSVLVVVVQAERC